MSQNRNNAGMVVEFPSSLPAATDPLSAQAQMKSGTPKRPAPQGVINHGKKQSDRSSNVETANDKTSKNQRDSESNKPIKDSKEQVVDQSTPRPKFNQKDHTQKQEKSEKIGGKNKSFSKGPPAVEQSNIGSEISPPALSSQASSGNTGSGGGGKKLAGHVSSFGQPSRGPPAVASQSNSNLETDIKIETNSKKFRSKGEPKAGKNFHEKESKPVAGAQQPHKVETQPSTIVEVAATSAAANSTTGAAVHSRGFTITGLDNPEILAPSNGSDSSAAVESGLKGSKADKPKKQKAERRSQQKFVVAQSDNAANESSSALPSPPLPGDSSQAISVTQTPAPPISNSLFDRIVTEQQKQKTVKDAQRQVKEHKEPVVKAEGTELKPKFGLKTNRFGKDAVQTQPVASVQQLPHNSRMEGLKESLTELSLSASSSPRSSEGHSVSPRSRPERHSLGGSVRQSAIAPPPLTTNSRLAAVQEAEKVALEKVRLEQVRQEELRAKQREEHLQKQREELQRRQEQQQAERDLQQQKLEQQRLQQQQERKVPDAMQRSLSDLPTGNGRESGSGLRRTTGPPVYNVNMHRQGRESKGDPRGGATAPPEFLKRMQSESQGSSPRGSAGEGRGFGDRPMGRERVEDRGPRQSLGGKPRDAEGWNRQSSQPQAHDNAQPASTPIQTSIPVGPYAEAVRSQPKAPASVAADKPIKSNSIPAVPPPVPTTVFAAMKRTNWADSDSDDN